MPAERRPLPELLEECLTSSDLDIWNTLIRQILPLVGGVVARSASRWDRITPELVEDLTQEAFLKLCKDEFAVLRGVRGRPEPIMIGFIKVTIANLVHDHFRMEYSEKRRPKAGFLSSDHLEETVGGSSAVDALQRGILLDQVDKILKDKLCDENSARDRHIFWLHHRNGMTAKAIASVPSLNLTEKGVESVLFRTGQLVKGELMDPKGISLKGTSV